MNSYENPSLSYECDLTAQRDRLRAERDALKEALREIIFSCDQKKDWADVTDDNAIRKRINRARDALARIEGAQS